MRSRVLMPALLLISLVLAALPALPGGAVDLDGLTAEAVEGTWYHVTFDAPIAQADLDGLRDAGAAVVAPLGGPTLVAWFDVAPTVDGATVRVRTPQEKLDPWMDPAAVQHLVVLAHADVGDEATVRFLPHGEVIAVREDRSTDGMAEVFLTGHAGGAAQLAQDPAVLYVGPASTGMGSENERSATIVAGTPGTPGYEGWLTDVGVTGAGVNVTVVDSGIDPYHPDLADAIVGKVERSQLPTGEPMDGGGHGTHVAGIVAGRGLGLSAVGRERPTEGGFLQGLGVAPGAGLIDQNVLGNTAAGPLCGGTWPPADWEPLTAGPLALDSHIWNASWQSCEGTGAGYIRTAAEMDRLTRDGDSAVEGAQPFTMVFSAGNSGSGANDTDTRLTAPKEAKNIIVVASLDVGNADQISSFSSRGPARDSRVVPTVAAPGGSVLSTRSTTSTTSCSTPYTGGLPEGLLYASCSGTSMASPHVAGAVALVTEWWRGFNAGADPSPAMVKALLVNTAVDMGEADIPNRHEGWGRVHLGNLFDDDVARAYLDQSVLLDDRRDGWTTTVDVVEGEGLRVTLAWTDAPNVPGAERALVNDLDLVLTAPDGTTYLGNAFAGGVSVAGGDADTVNNVENVFLADAEAGEWTVTVEASDLPGDGDPFAGDDTDQDFALVISG